MSHAALTAKYRPQTFADVAGQDTLKAILSRASLEGKVAPAYLFSGTRGVGKTTLARIFAKALNCRTAPTAEPCNACDQCRAVTLGNAVDVVEIDGASNRGIDDVRRLKEVVGYAAMEGGYKIFIIDEAHMLSREAFNALLKTLEEPPAKVTFILATTEPHKFPATIISRCQHYVFKRLPENALAAHLSKVLRQEGMEFDEAAVRLIARRGAGSVRDSMSLLGQVLALGAGKLTVETTRSVLGLAGQEAFLRMLECFRQGDSLTLVQLLREMLDQGLDMGFFLRELASLWRDLFILRQSGPAAASVVELPDDEVRALLAAGEGFSLSHIHACWQMTLEGQRRVLTSLEPALALELLLLNLAMLPKLLSLESLSALGRRGAPAGGAGNAPGGGPGFRPGSAQGGGTPGRAFSSEAGTAAAFFPGSQPGLSPRSSAADAARQEEPNLNEADIQAALAEEARTADRSLPRGGKENAAAQEAAPPQSASMEPSPAISAPADSFASEMPVPEIFSGNMTDPEEGDPEDFLPEEPEAKVSAPLPAVQPAASGPKPDWQAVVRHCKDAEAPAWFLSLAAHMESEWSGDTLLLIPHDTFTSEQMQEPEAAGILRAALTALCGAVPSLECRPPVTVRKTREQMQQEIHSHPLVQEMQRHFGARVLDYGQIR